MLWLGGDGAQPIGKWKKNCCDNNAGFLHQLVFFPVAKWGLIAWEDGVKEDKWRCSRTPAFLLNS